MHISTVQEKVIRIVLLAFIGHHTSASCCEHTLEQKYRIEEYDTQKAPVYLLSNSKVVHSNVYQYLYDTFSFLMMPYTRWIVQ